MIAAALLVLALSAPPASPGDTPGILDAARAAMDGQRWDEALALYGDARRHLPDVAEIPFNMGVAAYRAGDLARAADLFDEARTLAADPALRARSAYNLGTTAFRRSLEPSADADDAAGQLGDATADLREALDLFRETLDANPGDADARANGELTQRWLERLEQMQQQQQEQQRQQQGQQQQQQGQQQQEQPQQEPQPQEQEQTESRPSGAEGEQERQPRSESSPEPQPQPRERDQAAERRPMSREEAERLLQRVRDKTRQRAEELARQSSRSPVERDW